MNLLLMSQTRVTEMEYLKEHRKRHQKTVPPKIKQRKSTRPFLSIKVVVTIDRWFLTEWNGCSINTAREAFFLHDLR